MAVSSVFITKILVDHTTEGTDPNSLFYVSLQGFRCDDMRAWRQHWNHQLYKALEHQYQTGLEALNKNLPEIHVDLTFKSVHLILGVQLSISLFVSVFSYSTFFSYNT